jgi:hypothetical protein
MDMKFAYNQQAPSTEEEAVAMITQIYTEVIMPGEEIPDLFE